uniref:NHL repeat containing 4 n=1 Tax=Lepisosteus oculatus TaxID=7918 RepID=W5NNI7_LEPOC
VGPSLRLLSVRSVTGLSGPRHVCGTPDGGFAVSEECGGVKLYGPRHRLLRSLGETPAFRLGNPAGVAVDPGGNVLVADEQERSVVLFPPRGEPVAVVTEGLRKPAGLACCERGRVYVADPPDGCVKVFCYRGDRH